MLQRSCNHSTWPYYKVDECYIVCACAAWITHLKYHPCILTYSFSFNTSASILTFSCHTGIIMVRHIFLSFGFNIGMYQNRAENCDLNVWKKSSGGHFRGMTYLSINSYIVSMKKVDTKLNNWEGLMWNNNTVSIIK